MTDATTTALPLEGLKVLDFTQNLPGPYATSLLASMGAEVIKVEPPRGDPARHSEPLFTLLNRGKRSVVLDLRSEESRPALDRLIRWAEVLVEGFRPGVMERLGADEPRARGLNPELIYCSISAYGQSGPRSGEPGHDLNLQALTGLCWLDRDKDDQPRPSRLPLADLSTAMAAVASICASLARRQPGGAHLDVAMSDALLSWVSLWSTLDVAGRARAGIEAQPGGPLLSRLAGGLLERLEREKLYAMPQYNLYPTRDGRHLAIGIVDEAHFWQRLCQALGLGPLGKAPLPPLTLVGPLVSRLIRRRTRRFDRDDLIQRLLEADVPVSPALRADELPREPQFEHRQRFDAGGAPLSPLPLSTLIDGPAPKLGEHTEAILAELERA